MKYISNSTFSWYNDCFFIIKILIYSKNILRPYIKRIFSTFYSIFPIL